MIAMKPHERQSFDGTLEKANDWLADVQHLLGIHDSHRALAALRATLHALRDRLGVEEAAQLGAQLPLLIRGLYYENWKPAATPVRIRRAEEFLAYVARDYGRDGETEDVVRAVLRVLARHVSPGELESIRHALPRAIGQFVPPPGAVENGG